MRQIFYVYQYINFVPLFKKNTETYIFFIILIIALIYVIILILLFMVYNIKNRKINLFFPLLILRICLPFISYFFFGQIFSFLISIFYCRKEESFESPYMQCLTGLWIYSIAPFAIIAMIFQTIIGFISNSLYYKPIFYRSGSDILQKSDSFPDIYQNNSNAIIYIR